MGEVVSTPALPEVTAPAENAQIVWGFADKKIQMEEVLGSSAEWLG